MYTLCICVQHTAYYNHVSYLVFGVWSYMLDMWMRASLDLCALKFLSVSCCCYCVLLWLLLFFLCFCSYGFLCEWHRWRVKSVIWFSYAWLVCDHFKPGHRWTMRGKINKCTYYAYCMSFVLVIYIQDCWIFNNILWMENPYGFPIIPSISMCTVHIFIKKTTE